MTTGQVVPKAGWGLYSSFGGYKCLTGPDTKKLQTKVGRRLTLTHCETIRLTARKGGSSHYFMFRNERSDQNEYLDVSISVSALLMSIDAIHITLSCHECIFTIYYCHLKVF